MLQSEHTHITSSHIKRQNISSYTEVQSMLPSSHLFPKDNYCPSLQYDRWPFPVFEFYIKGLL